MEGRNKEMYCGSTADGTIARSSPVAMVATLSSTLKDREDDQTLEIEPLLTPTKYGVSSLVVIFEDLLWAATEIIKHSRFVHNKSGGIFI